MTQNGKILKEAMERLTNPKNTPVRRNKPAHTNGGGLLSKSVTCSSCGHSWKSVEGGSDPLTCHNCGGMVRMDKGGQSEGPGVPAPVPVPYSREYMHNLQNEYDQFYGPPKKYRDDGFDEFYYDKRRKAPLVSDMRGPGWLTTYDDGFKEYADIDQIPLKDNAKRKTVRVESYDFGSSPFEGDLNSHVRTLLLNKGNNRYAPEYRRSSFQKGGQTSNDREMVNGIADILSQVNDKQNRAQIARQMINDFNSEDVTYDYDKFMKMSKLAAGGMIKRADGSYSRRGMWDNIRANAGSGKKPSREMLEQERKIRSQEKSNGGPINKQDMHSIYDMMPHLAGGGTNNPGFEALPPYVQAKILSNMGLGGYFNPYMEAGGSTFSGNAFYGDGGYYPMYAEAGPVDPDGRWHGEWQDDPMLAEQFGYPAENSAGQWHSEWGADPMLAEKFGYSGQGNSEDEIIASQDAANVAATPMKPVKIAVNTPKSLPGKKGQSSRSIVDFLNSQDAKSDFATRKAVAENVYGFTNYTGSATQNMKLLALMGGNSSASKSSAGRSSGASGSRSSGASSASQKKAESSAAKAQEPARSFWDNDAAKQSYLQAHPGMTEEQYNQRNSNAFKNAEVRSSNKAASSKAVPGKYDDKYFSKNISPLNTDYRNQAAFSDGVLNFFGDVVPSAVLAGAGPGIANAAIRGLMGTTKVYPYGLRAFSEIASRAGQANRALPYAQKAIPYATRALPGAQKALPYATRALPGFEMGGNTQIGQEMDVTPEEMEMLRQQGYQFEII